MLYKNILVAYDGSEPSTEALAVAKDLIDNDESTTLHIISVVAVGLLGIPGASSLDGTSGVIADPSPYDDALQSAQEDAMQDIDQAIDDLLSEARFKIDKKVMVASKAADGICEYAREKEVDMIVMGRRGLGAFGAILGSVSYSVLHQMKIPVVTVK